MDDANIPLSQENSVHVQIREQLDCLNTTSEKINVLENKINVKRNEYRQLLSDSSRALNLLSQKLGDCIAQARPYYEAKRHAKEAQILTEQAAIKFDRAVSVHSAAREMVTVTENGIQRNSNNAVWFEMLNRANEKVVEAEMDKFRREVEHQKRAAEFKIAEDRANKLKNMLKSSIKRSRPYYEMKRENQENLERISTSVKEIAKELNKYKLAYSKALKNLESISNALHVIRQSSPSNDINMSLFGGMLDDTQISNSDDEKVNRQSDVSESSTLKDLNLADSLDQIESLTFISSISTNQDDPSLISLKSRDSNATIFSEAKLIFDEDEAAPTTSNLGSSAINANSFLPSRYRMNKYNERTNDIGNAKVVLKTNSRHSLPVIKNPLENTGVILKNNFFGESSQLSNDIKVQKLNKSNPKPMTKILHDSNESPSIESSKQKFPSTKPSEKDSINLVQNLSKAVVLSSDVNSNLKASDSKPQK